MGKRIAAFLLVLAMIVGMLPATAFAAETSTEPSNVINAPNGTVTLDGGLDEEKWALVGHLTEETNFGAIYGAGYLYLGVNAVVDSLSVTLNGVEVTAETVKGENATEAKISLADANLELTEYDQTASLKITAGENTWEGTVRFGSSGWLHMTGGTPTYNAGDKSLNGGSNDGNGVINFYTNKGGTSAATTDRVYAALGGQTQKMASGTSVFEFDLQVDKMPEYEYSSLETGKDRNYFFPGMNLGVYHNNSKPAGSTDQVTAAGYIVVVSRIKDYQENYDGLYLMIGASNAAGSEPYIFPLNKALGEQFHLRFEYTVDSSDGFGGDLVAYCDDIMLGSMKDVADARSYSNNGGGGINMNSWVKGAANVAAGEVNFTVSKIIYGTLATGSIMDNLTVEDILGENNSAETVSSDLVLPAVVTDPMLGDAAITWTSSDTSLIGNDGVVVPDVSGKVTMTAALAANPEITKSFDLTVSCDVVDAVISTEEITLDGVLSEGSWSAVAAANTWLADALWNNGSLWLALETGDATSMNLTLGEKTWEITLAETVEAEGITGAVKDGVAELKIDLAAAGIELADYGEKYAFQIEVGETKLADEAIAIRFTGREVNFIDWSQSTLKGGASTTDGVGTITSTGGTSYHVSPLMVPGFGGVGKAAGDIHVSTMLKVTSLPTLSDIPTFSDLNGSSALTLWLADCYELYEVTKTKCYVAYTKIYTTDGENLKLAIRSNDGNVSFDMGVTMNQDFELSLLWTTDATLTAYVNGQEIGSASNVNYDNTGAGQDVVYFRAQTATTTAYYWDTAVVGTVHTSLTDEVVDAIENQFASVNLSDVSDDLPMSSTVTSEHLGDIEITWTSSNTSLIGNDGTVTVPEAGSLDATISASMNGTEIWTADVTVVNKTPMLDAVLATDGITVDGSLSELQWVKWSAIDGDASGSIAAVWDKGHVYMAIVSKDAANATLVINGTTVTVDLVNGTVSGLEGAVIAGGNGTVEIDLPLAAMDVYPADYNDTTDLTVSLTGGNGTAASDLEKLRFTGKTVNITAVSNTSPGWTFAGSVYNFESVNDTSAHYIYAVGNNYSLTETTYITQELYFKSLPVTDGGFYDAVSAKGYYFYASRNCPNYNADRKGDMFFVVIYNAGDGKLMANILQNTAIPNATIDLGVNVGDEFRLTSAWNADGSVELYVNGILAGKSNGNATYTTTGMGDNVLTFRYRGTGTEEQVSYRMQNVTVMKTSYTSVIDELTPANVLNRADLEHVTTDLPMTSTYSSKYFEAIPISWITSDESVIEADGTIHRGETAKTCQISLVYNGEILWTKDVTVNAIGDSDKASSPIYTTAFANDITVNGDLLGENWHMSNKLLDANSVLVGEMGAAWDLENLYVAIRNSGNDVSLTVNGEKIDLTQVDYATSGDYIEIAIPMTYIGVAINGYGLELPISVTAGEGSYEGTLVLSGTDWWGAGNAQDPLPVLANNVKSVALLGGAPDGNQGAVEVTNGWHLYDRYSEDGTNPCGVRTYILFMRTSPYENFGNRDGTTTVEFDFQALSMPQWDLDESLQTSNTAAFANYGLNWSLSDAANSQKYSNVLTGGIVNTADGLYLVVRGNSINTFALGKEVGDLFRITLNWHTDNTLEVLIDGEHLTTVDNLAQWCGSVGDTSFVINMIRNDVEPESAADDMDVYMTNIAFGSAYSDDPLDTLSWDDIKGENSITTEVKSDLVLPTELVNEQLGTVYPLTWTSSHPDVVDPETGKVTRPGIGAEFVTLTATMEDGSFREFNLIIWGTEIDIGNTLVVSGDTNPAVGVGVAYETVLYTFDTNNNSIIEDMQESKTINVVKLTDLDAYARINRESLTLWISDDNATYTQVEDYKLTQVGQHWYLYDFEATGRYVKVHYTHWEGTDADFIAPLGDIIHGYYEEIVGMGTGEVLSKDYTYTNTSGAAVRDGLIEISKSELGITGDDASIRVYLGTELLYHYVSGDTIYARVPDVAVNESVTLTVKYGTEGAVDLANKEACIEVTYGTRETYVLKHNARWLLTIPAGTYGEHVVEKEMLIGASGSSIAGGFMVVSYDKGLTWSKMGTVSSEAVAAAIQGAAGDTGAGGWIFDETTGAIFFETHNYKKFDTSWQTSDCVNMIIGSYDMGKTWELIDVIEPDVIDGQTYTYMLSYSDGLTVSSYDGEGPNIDFVFPTGAQYTNTGAFCCRVVYSADAGKTWQMSETLLTYGAEKGHEGGLSEGWILENEDGVLVLYSRCQFDDVVQFAKAYSYDFGLTWTACQTREEWEASGETGYGKITCLLGTVYSSNTQALMYEYPQYNGIDAPLFLWGGNNTLGGTSYVRTPLNVAVSYDGLETFRNIQNLFLETYQDVYTEEGRSVITNHSVKKVGEDTLVATYSRLRHNNTVWMTVSDFENWLYRTKGAYDNFESGNPFYEGWSSLVGLIENTKDLASEGEQSLYIPKLSTVTRSIPYLQNGKISLDLYVTADTSTVIALQPAVGKSYTDYTVAYLTVDNMKLTSGDASVDLVEGWNTIEIELELTEASALMSANGGEQVAIALDIAVADYVAYVTVFNETDIYVDEFTVVSYLDAEVYTGETQKDAVAAVVKQTQNMIDAIGEVTLEDEDAIEAAREAYEALTDKQKAQVANLDVLTAAEEALYVLQAAYYDANGAEMAGYTLSLNGDIGMNFYMSLTDALLADDTAYVQITTPNGEVTKISVRDAVRKTVSNETFYVFSCGVAAKEMTEDVTVQLCNAYGEGKVYTYSVREYAEAILNDTTGTYSDVAPLVKAMLNYGAAAQIHFGYNTDNLANVGFETVLTGTIPTYETSAAGAGIEGVAEFAGSSLILESTVTMRMFFTVAEGADVTFTCGGEALTYVAVEGNDLYTGYVDVANIAAKGMDELVTVTVTSGESTADVVYTPMAYCYSVQNGEYAADLQDVAVAMYLYNQAANAYFN